MIGNYISHSYIWNHDALMKCDRINLFSEWIRKEWILTYSPSQYIYISCPHGQSAYVLERCFTIKIAWKLSVFVYILNVTFKTALICCTVSTVVTIQGWWIYLFCLCSTKFFLRLNTFSHWSHWYLLISLWTLSICSTKSLLILKTFSHLSHWYLLISLCMNTIDMFWQTRHFCKLLF